MAVASVGPSYEYILISKYISIFTIGRPENAAYIRPCLCKTGRSRKYALWHSYREEASSLAP